MTTYDVLVSDELLPEFTNDNVTLPDGFRIIGPVNGPSGYRSTRLRVEDDNAPAWIDGKLVDEEAVRIASAVERAEDNPGHTVRVEDAQ